MWLSQWTIFSLCSGDKAKKTSESKYRDLKRNQRSAACHQSDQKKENHPVSVNETKISKMPDHHPLSENLMGWFENKCEGKSEVKLDHCYRITHT